MYLKITTYLIGLFILLVCSASEKHSSPCTDDAGALMAIVYSIAVSYPDDLPRWVQENSALFTANDRWRDCCRVLITQLRARALSGPSNQSVNEHAADIAGRAGRPDLGPKIAEGMMEGRLDMFQLANWLEMLLNSLPSIRGGDNSIYVRTDIYTLTRLMWEMFERLLPPAEVELYRRVTMELNQWLVKTFFTQVSAR